MGFEKNLIVSLAQHYSARVPPSSLLELQDFIQEGLMIAKSYEPTYDPEIAKFTTYIYHPVRKRFQQMIAEEYLHYHNLHHSPPLEEEERGRPEEVVPCQRWDPYRHLKFQEAVEVLRGECPELADLILIGVPEEMAMYAKVELREKCERLGWDLSKAKFIINKSLIAEFYGYSEKSFAELGRKILKLV